MQNPILTPQEVAAIAQALDVFVAQSGNKRVLGAQLGAIISSAIRPKLLRELGGMRKVASEALAMLLIPITPSPDDSDVAFTIKSRPPQAGTDNLIPDFPTEVAGAVLWRLFSNPRLPCALTISESGAVLAQKVAPEQSAIPGALAGPSTEDYHKLAGIFASQEDDPVRSRLVAALSAKDFYNTWIAELRELRTPQNNLLKRWETLRSEFVATKLAEALDGGGLDAVRVSEIVSTARPLAGWRQQHQQPEPAKSSLPVVRVEASYQTHVPAMDELSSLRKILHNAIDRMSLAELGELRIPAGALIDIITK
jgi:hypothetical protein